MDLLEIEDRLTKLLDMVTVPHPLKAPVIAEIASLRDDVVEYRGGRAKMRHGMIGHAREIIDILTEVIRVELDDERRVKESQAERNAAKPADTPARPQPADEPGSPCLVKLIAHLTPDTFSAHSGLGQRITVTNLSPDSHPSLLGLKFIANKIDGRWFVQTGTCR